jgi:hypothetical protein
MEQIVRVRLIALLLLVPLLSPLGACSLFLSKETRALRKSPDYRAGYQDGCNSGYGPGADKSQEATFVRDEEAYRTNKAYRTGWGMGRNACRGTGYTGAMPSTSSGGGPVRDPYPGRPPF